MKIQVNKSHIPVCVYIHKNNHDSQPVRSTINIFIIIRCFFKSKHCGLAMILNIQQKNNNK